MKKRRRKYFLDPQLTVNNVLLSILVIDPHVDKHCDHISDKIIISLVRQLNGKVFIAAAHNQNYQYFVSYHKFQKKVFRLVWLQEKGCEYLGVITAFRDRGEKK